MRKTIAIFALAASFLWPIILAGCTVFSPSVTPFTPTPYPDFILSVHPEPGETLSVDSYMYPPTPETFEKDGKEYTVVEVDGFDPYEEVCVWFEVGALALNSSTLTQPITPTLPATPQADSRPAVIENVLATYTKLWIDGQLTAVYTHMGMSHITVLERDAQGNLIREYPTLDSVCAKAPLSAGVHRVDLSFEKSSGEVVSYSWTFQLVDE